MPIRKGGGVVAIGIRNICSGQLENRWGKNILKGVLGHGIGAREVGFSDLRANQTRWSKETVRL